MGAGQSTSGAATPQEEVKTSYYELLGVERQATDDDIKRAYRRKALELHPDRNYGKEEAATKLFAEVQAAYEVLSDPQERAWYDSHEGTILRGGDADSDAHYEANIRVTTADDISRMMKKFNRNVDFSDKPTGFFGFLGEFFAQLAKEEEAAARTQGREARDYPAFGHKDDRHEDVVREFYAGWNNFYTQKTFSWKDKWQPSMGRDRFERRHIEKENKKLREEGIKEFNDAMRTLVSFVRKRDPRYKPVVQSDAERQKALRDVAAEQAAKARAENRAKLDTEDAVPEWARRRDPEELEEEEEEEEELEEFECVACGKTFRSEKQFDAHEKSKKHQKAVQALKRKMQKDNKNLNLGQVDSSEAFTPMSYGEDEEIEADPTRTSRESHEVDEVSKATEDLGLDDEAGDEFMESGNKTDGDESPGPTSSKQDEQSQSEDDLGDEYAPRAKVEERLGGDANENSIEEKATSAPAVPKMGKAAQKRAKKAAKASEEGQSGSEFRCQRCNAEFPSKTKLFDHINKEGHAALKSATAGTAKGKKKGRR